MANKITFQKLSPFNNLYEATNGNLRSVALKLSSKSLCLVSHLANTSEEAWEELESVSEVKFIVAPNHYHNKGAKDATLRFPNAQFCAPTNAISRLEKVTGLSINALNDLEMQLPKNITIVEPVGLKTGEVWFCIEEGKNKALIVVDAFCGPKILKNKKENGTPQLLKTFPSYGVEDREKYQEWANNFISSYSPNVLIPCHGEVCHGEICRGDDLEQELLKCIDAL